MILSIIFVLSMVLANALVAKFGPWVIPMNSFFLIGLDFMIRDHLHDKWQRGRLQKMVCLILASGLISYMINSDMGLIAIASSIAFMSAMAVDFAVYHALRKKEWIIRANGSNIPASIVDSILFPFIVFGFVIPEVFLYQFLGKVGGGAIFSMLIEDFGFKKKSAV